MMNLYNEFTGLREDGRSPKELRLVDIHTSIIPGCTGSASFKIGQTEVIAQVFGPKGKSGNSGLNSLANIKCSIEYAQFAKLPHTYKIQSQIDRDLEIIIHRVFTAAIRRELYPNSLIEICVTIVQDDGSKLSAAINAVTLALLDGCIPMWDYVTSISVVFIHDQIFVDPGKRENSSRFPTLELAYMPSSQKIVSMTQVLTVSDKIADEMLKTAIDGCSILKEFIKNFLTSDENNDEPNPQ